MEYLMTYGWAILIVIIVGVVLWKSGVFSTTAKTSTNFNIIRPADWALTSSGLTVVWRNFGSGTARSVAISYSQDCTGATSLYTGGSNNFIPGRDYTDTPTPTTLCKCTGGAGSGYIINVGITYSSEQNVAHSENGTVRGPCE